MEETYVLREVRPPPLHNVEIRSQCAAFVVLALVQVQYHQTGSYDRLFAHVWLQKLTVATIIALSTYAVGY